MTDYQGQFLFPPRPDRAIPAAMLGMYERKDWIAQVKKNGTNNLIIVRPDRSLECWNRHKEPHKQWTPTAASSAAFKALPGSGVYVFVAELMHSKVAGGERDTNYLHDCLVADGEYLLGSAYMDRKNTLLRTFPMDGDTEDAYRINDRTFILKSFYGGQDGKSYRDRYAALSGGADEGLVLKDPGAKLRLCDRESANSDGMVKCRRQHKNYSF